MALLGRRGHPSYRRALLFYLMAIVGPTLVLFYLGLQSVQRQRPFYVVLRRLGVDSRIELEVVKPAATGNRCRENRPESERDRTCNQEKHGRASPKKSRVHFRALPSNAEPTFESNPAGRVERWPGSASASDIRLAAESPRASAASREVFKKIDDVERPNAASAAPSVGPRLRSSTSMRDTGRRNAYLSPRSRPRSRGTGKPRSRIRRRSKAAVSACR